MKFENLKIRFRKIQVSFLVVKTFKCKRGINFIQANYKDDFKQNTILLV